MRTKTRAFRSYAIVLAATLLVTPRISHSQGLSAEDSVWALMEAVTRMRIFEHQYHNLVFVPNQEIAPRLPSGGEINPYCETVVGDFCFRLDNGGSRAQGYNTVQLLQRYNERFLNPIFRGRARQMVNRYLALLAEIGQKIPGDRWIAGEYVRIALERGQLARAMDEALDCKSDRWWCSALQAHVLHLQEQYAGADSAWAATLALMSPENRCAWLDPTAVLSGRDVRRRLDQMDCEEKLQVANRTWWLSDPLYMMPGNERLAAHLSRQVDVILTEGFARHLYTTPSMVLRWPGPDVEVPIVADFDAEVYTDEANFGDPMPAEARLRRMRLGYPEFVLRAGSPVWAALSDGGNQNMPALMGVFPLVRASFVPSGGAVLDHLNARATDWNLRGPNQFEFLADWGREMFDLQYQIAYFKRGDSSRVVGVNEVPLELVLSMRTLVSAMFLQRDYNLPRDTVVGRGDGTRRRLIFDSHVRPESTVVSMEVRGVGGDAGRVRFAAGPPSMPSQRLTISDFLLVRDTPTLPASVEEAEEGALGTNRLLRDSRAVMFWEVYGLESGERPEVSVVVVGTPGGFLERLRRRVIGRGLVDSMTVEWEEPAAAGLEIEARAVAIDLRSLKPGDYTLFLEVRVPGQLPVRVARKVEVVGG